MLSTKNGSPKAAGGGTKEPAGKHCSDVEEESDDDEEILETAQNGRWQKINVQLTRDVPGIDSAHLAMDTEEGVEVVWNEVSYSNRKQIKGTKETLIKILQKLIEVKHTNIVNFISFWHDKVNTLDRLVFITEYMTSGSLVQFLNKAKLTKNTISEKMWRRWCRQILSALNYLHKNDIVHGNLSLATIFIQHNGLVKIGSVSPDAIHDHVKTTIGAQDTERLHYAAPEFAVAGIVQTSADIYAFGICALEMLNLDLLANGDSRRVNQDSITRAMQGLNEFRKEFISSCLEKDPLQRVTASALMKSKVLQEVFTLTVLSAVALNQRISQEEVEELVSQRHHSSRNNPELILAETFSAKNRELIPYRSSQAPNLDVDKLFEEIMLDLPNFNESRPSAVHSPQKKDDSHLRAVAPSSQSSSERNSSLFEKEIRKILCVHCDIKTMDGEKHELQLRLTFEDKMDRELTSELKEDDEAKTLAWDLVFNGLASEGDVDLIAGHIDSRLQSASWRLQTV